MGHYINTNYFNGRQTTYTYRKCTIHISRRGNLWITDQYCDEVAKHNLFFYPREKIVEYAKQIIDEFIEKGEPGKKW